MRRWRGDALGGEHDGKVCVVVKAEPWNASTDTCRTVNKESDK